MVSSCVAGGRHSSNGMAPSQKVNARRPVRSWLSPILTIVLNALVFAYGVKHQYLNWSWLAANKDTIAALNSLTGVAGIFVGGILAYYRFFRGRTFSTRAELTMNISVLKASADKFLHVLTLSIKNVGTVSIWNPQPIVKVSAHRGDGSVSAELVDNWYEAALATETSPRLSVLDSGESCDFFMQRSFPEDVWAVTYSATVHCSTRDSWTKLATVENRVPASK
jgi:hypothetical protein